MRKTIRVGLFVIVACGAGGLAWNLLGSTERPPITQQELMRTDRNATEFLLRRVDSDSVLACRNSRTGTPVSVHNSGQVFVLSFLAQAVHDRMPELHRQGLAARIRRLARDASWGYSRVAPVDSDDSAFALRALLVLGFAPDDPFFVQAVQALEKFRVPQSPWYRTFLGGTSSAMTTEATRESNGAVHPEVAANIGELMRRTGQGASPALLELVEAANRRDELPRSYFYPSEYYASMQLGAALRGEQRAVGALRALRERIASRQNADGSWGKPGSPYETALAMLSLVGAEQTRLQMDRALAYLVGEQRDDGSWEGDGVIWSFIVSDEPRASWEAVDETRVFTTSVVLMALRSLPGA